MLFQGLKFKYFDFIFVLLCLLLLGYFISLGPILAPDSGGYINNSITRGSLYPLLINFFTLFDNSHFVLVVFQLLLGFGAIFIMVFTLKSYFQSNINKNAAFNNALTVILTGVLVFPYFGKLGNYVLTEGIAYPLFLLAFCSLLKGLLKHKPWFLIAFFVLSGLLVLIRAQFLFMYIVGFVGISSFVISKYKNKSQKSSPGRMLQNVSLKKIIAILSFSLIAIIVTCNILEKAYHYKFHGEFAATPSIGIHLAVTPFYLSSLDDVQHVKSKENKELFLEMRENIDDLQFHDYFYVAYDEIVYSVFYPTLEKNGITNHYDIDKTMMKFVYPLVKANWKKHVEHFIRVFSKYLGGYYFVLFVALIFIMSFLRYFKRDDKLSQAMFFATLLHLGNTSSLAIIQSVHFRYSCYTSAIFLCMLIIYVPLTLLLRGEAESNYFSKSSK